MSGVPRLMAISSGRSVAGSRYSDWLQGLRSAGVESVQIREKTLEDRELVALVTEAVRVMAGCALVVVNGRADIALACGADGVHLPGSGIPVAAARKLAGGKLLVGRSTHSLPQVEQARDAGADYVFFGPIYETPGKGTPVGVEELARATALGVPVIALGGITIERLGALARAGAAGAAGIRIFERPGALERLVGSARDLFKSTR